MRAIPSGSSLTPVGAACDRRSPAGSVSTAGAMVAWWWRPLHWKGSRPDEPVDSAESTGTGALANTARVHQGMSTVGIDVRDFRPERAIQLGRGPRGRAQEAPGGRRGLRG